MRSIATMRLNLARLSVTPSGCGSAPPDRPVPAPRATTGTSSRWQIAQHRGDLRLGLGQGDDERLLAVGGEAVAFVGHGVLAPPEQRVRRQGARRARRRPRPGARALGRRRRRGGEDGGVGRGGVHRRALIDAIEAASAGGARPCSRRRCACARRFGRAIALPAPAAAPSAAAPAAVAAFDRARRRRLDACGGVVERLLEHVAGERLGGVGGAVLHRRGGELGELVGERAPPLHRVDRAGRRLGLAGARRRLLRRRPQRAAAAAGGASPPAA